MQAAGPSIATQQRSQSKDDEVDEILDSDFEDDEDTDDPNLFRIRNSLQPHSSHIRTIRELYSMMHDGTVDLCPPYQRGVVWADGKKVHLIDSIFRNFHIPSIVFAVRRDEEGEEIRVCVDGKQRLTSILKFIEGNIPYRDPVTKKAFYFTTSAAHKVTRLEVPQRWREWFLNRTIATAEYSHLTAVEEREIFQRVQLGIALNNAEKLRAVSSEWAVWIGQLQKRHIDIEDGLSFKLDFDTKRGRDFQNLAYMVFCIQGLPDQMVITAQRVDKWLSGDDGPSSRFKQDVEEVLRSLWIISDSNDYNEAFRKIESKVAPVEFIFIGVLLYLLRAQSYSIQGRAVYILRHTIRYDFQDVKNNTTITKAIWKYIDRLTAQPLEWIRPAPNHAGKRKKAAPVEEDDDDEFRPKKRTSTSKRKE